MATRREMRGFGNTGYRCSKHLGTISYSISKEAVYIVSRTRLADLISIFGSPPSSPPHTGQSTTLAIWTTRSDLTDQQTTDVPSPAIDMDETIIAASGCSDSWWSISETPTRARPKCARFGLNGFGSSLSLPGGEMGVVPSPGRRGGWRCCVGVPGLVEVGERERWGGAEGVWDTTRSPCEKTRDWYC